MNEETFVYQLFSALVRMCVCVSVCQSFVLNTLDLNQIFKETETKAFPVR